MKWHFAPPECANALSLIDQGATVYDPTPRDLLAQGCKSGGFQHVWSTFQTGEQQLSPRDCLCGHNECRNSGELDCGNERVQLSGVQ
jgi:hypothetical protein